MKLQNLTQEPSVNPDELLATATTTFHNWDQEEVKALEREERKENKQA